MSRPDSAATTPAEGQRASDVRRLVVLAAVLSILAAGLVLWFKLRHDPNVIWLSSAGGAQWIRDDQPFHLVAHHRTGTVTIFTKRFELSQPTNETSLEVHALKLPVVNLDGEMLYEPESLEDSGDWKQPIQVTLPPLEAGAHELGIAVGNPNGPSALRASIEALGISTDSSWTAATPSSEPRPAALANNLPRPRISELFSERHQVPPAYVWGLGAVFVVMFAVTLTGTFSRFEVLQPKLASAAGLRWVLIAAWGVLAIHNFTSLTLDYGFDRIGHLEYVDYLQVQQRIPVATDGWQMFQSPLYYLLAAWMQSGAAALVGQDTSWQFVLLCSMVAGAAQVEVAFRALKAVFPSRQSGQCLGLLVAGLMPMSLYLSQMIGNEPLAGLFGAGAVTLAMVALQNPASLDGKPFQLGLGLLLGLALLTKVSAVLLVLPVAAAVAFAGRRGDRSWTHIALSELRVFLAAVLVSGWYYVRNWYLLGKPFIGGWDPLRGIEWWQDPGYRTWDQFTSFGESLQHPIYAGYAGFWDALYSTMWLDGFLSGKTSLDHLPPWNYGFMLAGAWLAMLPLLAILVGIGAAFLPSRPREQPALVFGVGCLAVYLAAMLYLYLQVPIYSTAKASYTLSLLPCYAVLAAAGFDIVARHRVLRAVVVAWMSCWAICAWSAYVMA